MDLQAWIAGLHSTDPDGWLEAQRWYAKNDLFYLLNFILLDGRMLHSQEDQYPGKPYHFDDYFLQCCRTTEFHARSGTGVDASARGSAKSQIRTKALAIQLILNEPNICIMIFSVQKQLAKRHLKKIKDELQQNELLKELFPEILWANPKDETLRAAISWSLDDGICVKRQLPRGNNTVEVHDIFGGGPVGSRPDVIIADDVENSSVVNTSDAIAKLKSAFSECVSLLSAVVVTKPILIMSNTRFHPSGLVQSRIDRLQAEDPRLVRMIPAEDTTVDGDCPGGGTAIYPFTSDYLWWKYNEMEVKREYGLQFVMKYDSFNDTVLNESKIQFYDGDPMVIGKECAIYMCIDASMGVKDPTCIWVWGIDKNGWKWWLDCVTRKMDPSKQEFHDEVYKMLIKWQTYGQRFIQIRVDAFGNQPWPELIAAELRRRGVYAHIVHCTAVGTHSTLFGKGKVDRIYQRWSPMIERQEVRFPLPASKGGKGLLSRNSDGAVTDMVEWFLTSELRQFPGMRHDDMLDAGALLYDEKANKEYPLERGRDSMQKVLPKKRKVGTSYMSG